MHFLSYMVLIIFFFIPGVIFLLDMILVFRSHVLTVSEQRQDSKIKKAKGAMFSKLLTSYADIALPFLEKTRRSMQDNDPDCKHPPKYDHDIELATNLIDIGIRLYEATSNNTSLKPVFPALGEPDHIQKNLSFLKETNSND